MSINNVPMEWVKTLETKISELSKASFFENFDTFPFNELSNEFSKHFSLPSLVISGSKFAWKSTEEVLLGLTHNIVKGFIRSANLKGELAYVINQSDLEKVISWILDSETQASALMLPSISGGFSDFFAAKVLGLMEKASYLEGVNFRLAKSDRPFEDILLSTDIEISNGKDTCSLRLIFNKEFVESLNALNKEKPAKLSQEEKKNIKISLHFEIGETLINYSELKRASLGDFIALDKVYYNPEKGFDGYLVTSMGQALFKAEKSDNKIELKKLINQEDEVMDQPEEIPEEKNDTAVESTEALTSIKDIPVTVKVEMTKLKMSANELFKLKPGNVLELDSSPDSLVSLVVDSKTVGRGELIRIGEVLGVRITDLG